MAKAKRAALYLRVSTDGQTTDNQRQALEVVVARRGWEIVKVYEDAGVSGSKGRDRRPGFDAAMKDAGKHHYDILVVWSIDRLGRSTSTVAGAMADLDAAGVAIFADREGMDATTPHGRAMLQMAAVFAELERGMIVERVNAGIARARKAGKVFGRPMVGADKEGAIRVALGTGAGMLKVAKDLGVGTSVVQRVKKAMLAA